jgi:hypothetical protein
MLDNISADPTIQELVEALKELLAEKEIRGKNPVDIGGYVIGLLFESANLGELEDEYTILSDVVEAASDLETFNFSDEHEAWQWLKDTVAKLDEEVNGDRNG